MRQTWYLLQALSLMLLFTALYGLRTLPPSLAQVNLPASFQHATQVIQRFRGIFAQYD